ncbi:MULTISPECIES: hypothetical protein [Streptomyces]|uniref:S1 motif domain-containing protein n=1 Tax=Streptomyces ehimensis TaxID=68195 RepID=A0ABV9BWX4_9ACTN
MVTDAEWERIRGNLRFGQVLRGTVANVPRPGAIGIFVDIGLGVGGFVDVLLLPKQVQRWPVEGTVTDFEVWWADSRQQVRLKPSDPHYLRDDFTDFIARVRPGWTSDIGQLVRDGGPVTEQELTSLLDRQAHHEGRNTTASQTVQAAAPTSPSTTGALCPAIGAGQPLAPGARRPPLT